MYSEQRNLSFFQKIVVSWLLIYPIKRKTSFTDTYCLHRDEILWRALIYFPPLIKPTWLMLVSGNASSHKQKYHEALPSL